MLRNPMATTPCPALRAQAMWPLFPSKGRGGVAADVYLGQLSAYKAALGLPGLHLSDLA